VSHTEELLSFLRTVCGEYSLEPKAVYRRGLHERWPLSASSEEQLERELQTRGHFIPLPKEPAALANVIEVSVLDFLVDRLQQEPGIEVERGTERGYPDLEISGPRFGGVFHALDVKVARRAPSGRQTQSRITLYTGNTYFAYPELTQHRCRPLVGIGRRGSALFGGRGRSYRIDSSRGSDLRRLTESRSVTR